MIRFRRTITAAAAALAALTLVLSGCSAAPKSEAGAVLRVWDGSPTPLTANFNPFSPTMMLTTLGVIYEPLFFYNKLADEPPVGLLGDSYEFNDDGTVLTVRLKEGLLWSDGQAITSADVVYSFKHEGYQGAVNDLVAADAPDETTVVLTFTTPQFAREYVLLGTIYMLPKHIWSQIDDYFTNLNPDPVGSGPYVVEAVTEASYTLTANENFRDEGAPAIPKLQYIGINDNQSAQDMLRSGSLDWVGMFIPNPEEVTSNGIIKTINTPHDPTVVYTCSNVALGCEGEQTDLAVRQALNVAIDRGAIREKAFVGLADVMSPTYLRLPRDQKWLADEANAVSPQEADAAQAGTILEAAGYTKDADGFYGKNGSRIELDLISVDGWTDYNDAAKLVAEQATAAGIKVNASTVTFQEYSDSRQTGQFELVIGEVLGTAVPDPHQTYKDWFTTGATAKVGEQLAPGTWNFSRYSNPLVDEAVHTAAGTTDVAVKQEAYAVVQREIVRDLPYIPLVLNAQQTFYNARDFEGWPTEQNLYAFPPAWSPAAGFILPQLTPVR